MNVSPPAISQFEKKENLELETIKKIAAALDVPYTDLLSDTESKGYFMFDFSEDLEKKPNMVYLSKEDIEDYKNNKREFSQEWIDQYTKMKHHHLNSLYNQLNEKGQDKAIEHVEMLTKIDEYKK